MGFNGTSNCFARLEAARGCDGIVGAHPESRGAGAHVSEVAAAREADPKRRPYDCQLGGARIQVRMPGVSPGSTSEAGAGELPTHEDEPLLTPTAQPSRRDAALITWPSWPRPLDSTEAKSPEWWASEASGFPWRTVDSRWAV